MPIQLACIDTPRGESNTLSFSQCEKCNTIQLDDLVNLATLYSNSHNYTSVGNIWEKYFLLFIENIEELVNNKTVLEIGCPSGKIATNLKNYNKWYIVEPNKNPSVIFNEKITFINKYFDNDFTLEDNDGVGVSVIVHSHLFEHIYEPNSFLSKCCEILKDDGEMFFGVPNMQTFVDTTICPFLGVFFEHTIFLNKENITHLLKRNNFEIVNIIDYESHSTLYHCKKIYPSCPIPVEPFSITNYYDSFFDTLDYYKTFIKMCNDVIESTTKDVYIFAASYNSQLLLAMGLYSNKIKGILDNSKDKQDKYLYGYNLQIFNPSIISNNNCIVILKNGYYANEVFIQLKDINKNVEIIL
jgi:2-polyprenyl-3-methyl-5-hydroxy-6-metoxy-1,4-benzoquinol methylase